MAIGPASLSRLIDDSQFESPIRALSDWRPSSGFWPSSGIDPKKDLVENRYLTILWYPESFMMSKIVFLVLWKQDSYHKSIFMIPMFNFMIINIKSIKIKMTSWSPKVKSWHNLSKRDTIFVKCDHKIDFIIIKLTFMFYDHKFIDHLWKHRS